MEYIGWLSSIILSITLIYQVYNQWRAEQSEGVSLWLFIGQLLANLGFVIYSYSSQNWIFLCTNSLLVLTNIVGFLITLKHKNKSFNP